jgi:23S rRNA pseudouridine955/2504/2580 synthase
MSKDLHAGPDDDGRRLDRIIRRVFPELPLSRVYRLFRQKRVLVNGEPGGADCRIAAGSVIRVMVDDAASPADTSKAPARRSPALPGLIREEGGLIFINKPPGIATHGPGSLDTLVQDYLAPKRSPSLSFRPGPLHRLDKPASGLIVFSASLEGARQFSALLREGRLIKRYLALADGSISEPAYWEDALLRDRTARKTLVFPAGGGADTGEPAKPARTRVFPLARNARYTLLMLEIGTGRTHQIRAQAAFHGHPLAGDGKYGGSRQAEGLLLHSWSIEFPQTDGTERKNRITAPVHEVFSRRIRNIFGEEFPYAEF